MGNDRSSIRTIVEESASVRPASPKGIDWRRKWIEVFLRTKRDEGLLFADDLMHLHAFDHVQATPSDSNWMKRA